jgi:hypothetical protein
MSWAKTASAASIIARRAAARAGRALRLAAFRSPAIATANHRSPTWAAPVRRISGAAAASVNWRTAGWVRAGRRRIPIYGREQTDEGCDEAYWREEGVGAFVLPGRDAASVFEAAEKALDDIAAIVGALIVAMQMFSSWVGRDDRRDAAPIEFFSQAVGVVRS